MPSRIDIPLSGSAPGNGSAGLDGDVPRNAALAVRMLRYERVPVLDKQTGRPQEGPVMVGGKPLRNPDGSVRTGPVGTISGFYGETLCSHEKGLHAPLHGSGRARRRLCHRRFPEPSRSQCHGLRPAYAAAG